MPQGSDSGIRDDAVPSKDASSVFFRVTLCHAADVARTGRLAEAESVLATLSANDRGTPNALDLLARIRAHQGRLGEAETLWERAAQVEESPRFDAELAKVRALRNRPWWRKYHWWMAVVALGAATYLVAMKWHSAIPSQVRMANHGAGVPEAPIPSQTQLPAIAAAPPVLRVPAFPGVHVQREAKTIRFTFKKGLFTSGTEIRPDAYRDLDEVAAMLRELSGVRQVVVTGLTDAIPVRQGSPYQDNSLLGLARATEVVKYLAAQGGIPVTSFLVATGGDRGITQGTSKERDLTQRTVKLEVIPVTHEATGNR